MNAIQQRCRPKHQVLVLKCYPRTARGAVDVKPNSSELSYLLFYATSRRSKIQKVGQFLEKKTASDVWRLRIGYVLSLNSLLSFRSPAFTNSVFSKYSNVQVTLQILAALIEKSPKDLPLFASNVLTVLDTVLRSNDITMVEASLPTFETFCEHHDASSLFADQAYIRQYEDVVSSYAVCASTRQSPGKTTPSKPIALRWRNAGLASIKSIAESEALSSVAGRQLDVIVPMILENLWTDDGDFLQAIIDRADADGKAEGNALLRRRTSVSTVKTDATGGDTNPVAITGSSVDIDKLAEEDTAVVAVQCLKQIFIIPTRAQIQGGTHALLKFIRERIQEKEAVVKTDEKTGLDSGWAVTVFGLVAKWAPVQDRYIIMVAVMEKLLRTQPSSENVAEQNVLVAIIASLLRSDVNLIGLSVMDVLLGLLQHMKRVLKHSGGAKSNGTTSSNERQAVNADPTEQMSAPHKELLHRIEKCIADLATHVYYADQISDMISTILSRLKPHPSTANSSPPTEKADKTESAPGPTESTATMSEDQHNLDNFFTLDLAKLTTLRAIKSIFLVANPQTKISGNANLTRNKVPIQVWEGTQWLLRDPDGQVRNAYADAIVTWLERETTKADWRAREEPHVKSSNAGTKDTSRRGVSGASRAKAAKGHHCHFLELLHLAIYDNALQFIEHESDLVTLHVLLYKLVDKLGVNAAKYGLPMIFRLQEDIQEVETPLSKVRLGCLCHGYFWALMHTFEFEGTAIGTAIQNEISRRRTKHFWVEGIHVPPPQIDSAGIASLPRTQPTMPVHEVESEALLPFDDRLPMVEHICANYEAAARSPPASPPTSPGRTFTHPILSSTLSPTSPVDDDEGLPAKYREDMMIDWTREAATIALQQESKSASISGSKSGTTNTQGGRLTVNGLTANGQSPNRPISANQNNNLRPRSHSGAQHLGPVASLRKTSVHSRGSGKSSQGRGMVASLDQLKSALSGDAARPPTFRATPDDEDSDSVASYDFTPSEVSFNPAVASENGGATEPGLTRTRSKSSQRRASGDSGGPLTSHPTDPEEVEEEVPPVPPLPEGVVGRPPTSSTILSRPSTRDRASTHGKRGSKSRTRDSIISGSFSESGSPTTDLQSMLKGIDSKSRENTIGNLTKPPY
ncbi:plasma membrane localization protein [Diatrype stigma]|uniref:Plasma membrane localization protein n=1 Tax=Diatrype stigma TaxID=117547 RepID=A0AAN9V8K8_9PEZI